jgi:hypothetical protein
VLHMAAPDDLPCWARTDAKSYMCQPSQLCDLGHDGLHYGATRLAYISEFIEQAKASGLVQQAIERAGLPGYKVAFVTTN